VTPDWYRGRRHGHQGSVQEAALVGTLEFLAFRLDERLGRRVAPGIDVGLEIGLEIGLDGVADGILGSGGEAGVRRRS
jgi:hypothetical protein